MRWSGGCRGYRLLATVAIAALAIAGALPSALAYVRSGPTVQPHGHHRLATPGGPPLDGFTATSGAYSFRKLRSAYAGSAVKLQRVDTTTQDVGFTAAGDFDTAASAVFCTTACTVNTWYDQSGLGLHLVQATAANQPAYVASCANARPCLQTTAAAQGLPGPTVTPATGVVSLSVVANRSAGTGLCGFLRQNGSGVSNRIQTGNAVANSWSLAGGASGTITLTVSDAAWHTGIGVIASSSSYFAIDGVSTAGTTVGNTAGAVLWAPLGVASTTCQMTEAVVWDNYSLTAGEAATLATNQRNYWMPAPLDSFTQPSGAYSFRRLRTAYAGPAIRIRRASDNAELDINFLGFTSFTGAPLDMAAAATHCNATNCYVKTWYDQSGLARDLIQTTVANQFDFVFNCNGSLPCVRALGVIGQSAFASSITPATGVVSMSAVDMHGTLGAGTPQCIWFGQNGNANNRLSSFTGGWFVGGGGSFQASPVPAVNVWHAQQGVVNGASSVINVDGVETTGSIPGTVTAGNPIIGYAGTLGTVCSFAEAIVWDNYVLAATERAALRNNQRSFWGTP